ncbi:MAG: thrombospondin type 3 repeat-containing protein [bacterium]|nr:thrombospondin type 3 repeat-containing protein [bacterium]
MVHPTQAVIRNLEGDWVVTSKGVSGAVGDIVSLEFSVTSLIESCADTNFYIKTTDEARQKVSLIGVTVPTDSPSVSMERIEWSRTEFESGIARKFIIRARIDRGVVGDEIDGFFLAAYACGRTGFDGVLDDAVINVVAQKPKVTPKSTSVSTRSPIISPVSAGTAPTSPPTLLPVFNATPTPTPANPIDPDGDGLPNDQEAVWGSNPYVFDTDADGMPDGDEIRNGTNPAGDFAITPTLVPTITPEAVPVNTAQNTSKPSFFSRLFTPFRAIGNWFSELF